MIEMTNNQYQMFNLQLSNTPWPKFHHDNKGTGLSPYASTSDGTLKWTYPAVGDLSGDFYGSPVISPDGTIYIGNDDHYLYAINPDGSLKWRYLSANYIEGSAAVASDGTIYFPGYWQSSGLLGYIYALNPDGTLKWTYPVPVSYYNSPAVGTDGTIYIGDRYGVLYAINSDGTLKWTLPLGGGFYATSPSIAPDGTIYIGGNKLYAVNPDGTLKWFYTTGGTIPDASPTIDSDGTIYIGCTDFKLYAINPDGTLKWSFTSGGHIWSSASIGPDGTIYFGSFDRKLYALDPINGTQKWNYTVTRQIYTTPAIDANGIIYFVDDNGWVYALNPDGTLKWSNRIVNWTMSSPSIDSDGTIYVGGSNPGGRKLFAFKSSSCPVPTKTINETINLKATPIQGVAPYTIEFRRAISQSMVDIIDTLNVDTDTYIIPGGVGGRLEGLSNPVSGVAEGFQVIRRYTIDSNDINSATSKSPGEGPTLLFGSKMLDSCNPQQICVGYCKLFVTCPAPTCDFTVT